MRVPYVPYFGVLRIWILRFRVLYEGPLFSETPIWAGLKRGPEFRELPLCRGQDPASKKCFCPGCGPESGLGRFEWKGSGFRVWQCLALGFRALVAVSWLLICIALCCVLLMLFVVMLFGCVCVSFALRLL